MVMLRLVLVFLFFCVLNLVYAQEFSWSDSIDKGSSSEIKKIISIEDSGVYTFLKESKSSYRVDFFSNDYKLQNTRRHKLDGIINSVFRVGNNIYVFYSRYNAKTKQDELYFRSVEKEGKEKLIQSNSVKEGYHNRFIVNVSGGFSKVVILTEAPYNEGKKEMLQIDVYNEELNLLRSKKYLIPGIYSQKRRVNIPLVNDKGEVYILKKYKTKQQSKYYVITNRASSVQTNEFKINHQILEANFTFTREGELVIAGTYGRVMNKAEGLYIVKMDNSGSARYKKEYPFRMETMTAFVSEKLLKKNGIGLSGFRTKQLIEMKEGGVVVLEHHARRKDKKTGKLIDERKGVIVFYFNHKGDYFWDRPILVTQKDAMYNGRWSSFVYYNDTANNEVKIIYNQLSTAKKKAKNMQESKIFPHLISVSSQGDFTNKSIEEKLKGKIIDPKNYTSKAYGLVLVARDFENSVYYVGEVLFDHSKE